MKVHLNYDPRELIVRGPTIDVLLTIDGKDIPGFPDDIQNARMPALIDTGATANSIDGSLATALNLPVVGSAHVSGIDGKSERPVHLAQIYVPDYYRISLHSRRRSLPGAPA